MKIRGFTPVFDVMVEKYGRDVALVYGKIWRYCDWSEMDICNVSIARLAKELDMSESTVKRARSALSKDGFIIIRGNPGVTHSVTVNHEVVMELQLIPKGELPEPKIEPPKRSKPERDKDIVDAVVEYASGVDISWMLPDTEAKIRALPERLWSKLSKSMRTRWNAHVSMEWGDYTPEMVAQAWEKHKKEGLAFGGPWSLDWAFNNLEPLESEVDKRRADLYGED